MTLIHKELIYGIFGIFLGFFAYLFRDNFVFNVYSYISALEPTGINMYSVLHLFLPFEYIGFLIGFLLFFICIFLLYTEKRDYLFYAGLLFLFSPVFFYSFLNPSQSLFGLLLLLLAWIFSQKKSVLWLFYLLIVLIATLDYSISIQIFLFILAFSTYSFNKNNIRIAVLFGFIFATINLFLNTSTFTPVSSFFRILPQFIYEFGYSSGTSFIVLVFALLGTLFFGKKMPPSVSLSLILVLFVSILTQNVVIFHFILSGFAGISLSKMISKQWTVSLLKYFSLSIIFLFLLLNVLSFTYGYLSMLNSFDGDSLFEALSDVPTDSLLLTSKDLSFMITYHTGIPTYLSQSSTLSKEDVFFATNTRDVVTLLQAHGVTHLLISDTMIEDIWRGRVIALRVLLRDTESFTTLPSSTNNFEVYKIK